MKFIVLTTARDRRISVNASFITAYGEYNKSGEYKPNEEGELRFLEVVIVGKLNTYYVKESMNIIKNRIEHAFKDQAPMTCYARHHFHAS